MALGTRGARALVMMAAVVLSTSGATVVGAQESVPDSRPPSGTTPAPPLSNQALTVAVQLGETVEKLRRVEAELAAVNEQAQRVSAELAAIDERLASNAAAIDEVRDRIRQRAAAAYVRNGSGPLAPPIVDSAIDVQAGRSYAAAASSVDGTLVDRLTALRDELQQDRSRKSASQQELADTRGHLVVTAGELDALRTQQQMLLDLWGAVPVLGKARLDSRQISDFFESTKIRPDLPPGITIADLARLYLEEGELTGVRGDIAFAQSIIETGSFTEFKGYNFSGIGVCDSCTGGYLFEAARDGIRAQMQLLRSYADATSRAADLPVPLSPVLYGTDAVEAARRFDTFFKKGSAPFWNDMGNGNWATDPNYAGKVLKVYARMIAFAESR